MKTDKNKRFLLKFGPDHIRDTHINTQGENEMFRVYGSPILSEHHKDLMLSKFPGLMHKFTASYGGIDDKHVSHYLSDEVEEPKTSYTHKTWHLLQNDNLRPQHLIKAINHKSFKRDDVRAVMLHPNFNSEVLGHLVKNPAHHYNIAYQFSSNDRDYTKKHVTDDHLQTMADDLNYHHAHSDQIRGLMQGIGFKYGEKDARDAEIDKIPTKLMDSLISSKNMYAKEQATSFQSSLQPHHIKALLNDEDTFLVGKGVSAPMISDDDLLRHAKHDDPLVRSRAKQHIRKRFGEYKLKELGIDS